MQRRKASRLLSSLLVCAGCGQRLRVNSRRAQGAKVESYGCRANTDGKRCEAPASINADAAEAFVTEALLEAVGALNVIERREVVRDVAGLAEVEEAIAHTTDAMREPGADLVALTATLSALVESREALNALPATPSTEEVDTGVTYADRWAAADLDERRALIAGQLLGPIIVSRVGRGYRIFNDERIAAPWRWRDDLAVYQSTLGDFENEGNSSGPNPDRSARRKPRASIEDDPGARVVNEAARGGSVAGGESGTLDK